MRVIMIVIPFTNLWAKIKFQNLLPKKPTIWSDQILTFEWKNYSESAVFADIKNLAPHLLIF